MRHYTYALDYEPRPRSHNNHLVTQHSTPMVASALASFILLLFLLVRSIDKQHQNDQVDQSVSSYLCIPNGAWFVHAICTGLCWCFAGHFRCHINKSKTQLEVNNLALLHFASEGIGLIHDIDSHLTHVNWFCCRYSFTLHYVTVFDVVFLLLFAL